MSNLKYLNLDIATKVIKEVEAVAKELGTPIVVAIANEWGLPIAVHFMDGALPASYDIAVNKAYTSATVRLSTEVLKELSRDGGELFGIMNTNNNKIVPFPGGFPLEVNGKVVGAIGISGGTADYDNKLAYIGREIYGEVAEWILAHN